MVTEIKNSLAPTPAEQERTVNTYLAVGEIAERHFTGTALVSNKGWAQKDIDTIFSFLAEAAPYANQKLLPSYWEHLVASWLFVKELKLGKSLEAAALLHDTGRLVDPGNYYRNNLIEEVMFRKIELHQDFRSKFPPIGRLLGIVEPKIQKIEDLSESQIILDGIDNRAKLNREGKIQSDEEWEKYVRGQGKRYAANGTYWPSVKKGLKALAEGRQEVAIGLAKDEIVYISKKFNLDFEDLCQVVSEQLQNPEIQNLVLELKNAQETLDPAVDKKLSRPPINTIVFDVGYVLLDVSDDELIKNIAERIKVPKRRVSEAFDALNTDAMAGKMNNQEYLEKFSQIVGKKTAPSDFEFPEIYHAMAGMPEIIKKLKQSGKDLWVYSNIIPLLTNVAGRKLREFYPQIDATKILFSCEVEANKQTAISFEGLNEVVGEGALFIDDVEAYTTSARLAGLRGFTFRGNPYRKVFPIHRLRSELKLAKLI